MLGLRFWGSCLKFHWGCGFEFGVIIEFKLQASKVWGLGFKVLVFGFMVLTTRPVLRYLLDPRRLRSSTVNPLEISNPACVACAQAPGRRLGMASSGGCILIHIHALAS